jgi:copper chaperone CopZ
MALMAHELKITGMHCGGCVSRVTKVLRTLDPGVNVTLDPPRAQFSTDAQISVDAVNAALAKAGEYRATEPG